ncbi:hypothetical protein RI129_010240 [Pyrocoelia pectoralis]|uniref:Uncharacterized protein n=1 Tax=Pyrocoelia pectoralis TaxID=417401 RepID=A0AAN7ZJS1_9COLE
MNWETKNRCGKSELNQQLYRIERECRDEMRMHDTRAQQFKTRRSRLNFYLDKDVHAMLFTNGELDVEKVLCLHLLTAHRAETLRPPVKTKRPISFLAKDQSPLEKLIERSRKRRIMDKHPKLTPTYVLDINNKNEDESEDDCVIRDGRLAERIIINDKILILIHTVLDALQLSNPEKMAELMSKAQDENILKEIIEKPDLQDFLQTLHKQLIISRFAKLSPRKPQITNLEQIDDDNIRRIDVDQLALIVDLHMKRLNCEDKRPTMYQKSTPLNVSDNTAKGRVGFKATRGSVDLNVYDLARISQEIRERETQQKLEKFLKNAADSSNNVITYK